MAPKRPSPLEQPPAASSSEEEEEASSEEAASGSEESESEKKPQPKAAAKPQDSSSGKTETGSESESDADALTQRKTNVKPMEVMPPPKATKPRSKVPASPPTAKSGLKRAGGETEVTKDSKKAKKKGDEAEEEGVEEESKKSKLFQRIWSDEDEIIILKGMNEYKTKKGVDPYSDMTAFHDFIKKSLKIDVSKIQLQDKIRRMKKKFENNVKKKQKPTKAHDSKTFELSKKVWGGEDEEDLAAVTIASFGKGDQHRSNGKVKNKTLEAEKGEAFPKPVVSYSLREVGLGKGFKEFGLSEAIIEQGLELIGGAKRAELEDRWSKLHLSELELFVQRTELMRDQANLIVEAFKKSDH